MYWIGPKAEERWTSLKKVPMIASSIVQFIPCIDVVGSILCYSMFCKEGLPKN